MDYQIPSKKQYGKRLPSNQPPRNRPPSSQPPGNRPPGSHPPGNHPPGNQPLGGQRPSQGGGRPMSPPPTKTPSRNTIEPLRVDQNSIRNCMFRFTYIWMINGDEFWMFPTSVSHTTVTGFRWNWRLGWSYTGVSLRQIASFTCR
ncbi:hypothetical protein LJC58_01110 [Lachnospiraceae bacterium OttesenSCG-928-D06]|nr:hypothetical protein [Lachnospiraceae bacterium OttesenSCG-928-D06]